MTTAAAETTEFSPTVTQLTLVAPLANHHIVSSMSAVGHYADNAAADGFFGSTKRERFCRQHYLRCLTHNDRSLWPNLVVQRSPGKCRQLMVANRPEAEPVLPFAAFTPSIYPSCKGDRPMSASTDDLLKQVDEHLSQANQAWLLGAGVSCDAGLPLMAPLTTQVFKLAEGQAHDQILKDLKSELPNSAHIEHMLSQLGDYTAIANRVEQKSVRVGGHTYFVHDLDAAHKAITNDIAKTIRWGYVGATDDAEEKVGGRDNIIVSVEHHSKFVHALFEKRQAGLREPRKPVHLFTTNYDTLLEDALALGCYRYWDGFTGGAVAFREQKFGKTAPNDGLRAKVMKLHGSIDWILGDEGDVWRVRDTDLYPKRNGSVLIYPQSTKYVATQRDPFAAQFAMLRDLLGSSSELVLAVCGYSFGDEHINEELERALSLPGNKATLIAFCRESAEGLPDDLESWRQSRWGERVYVLTQRGLYWGTQGPLHQVDDGEHDWWTFQGATRFLEDGGIGAL